MAPASHCTKLVIIKPSKGIILRFRFLPHVSPQLPLEKFAGRRDVRMENVISIDLDYVKASSGWPISIRPLNRRTLTAPIGCITTMRARRSLNQDCWKPITRPHSIGSHPQIAGEPGRSQCHDSWQADLHHQYILDHSSISEDRTLLGRVALDGIRSAGGGPRGP